jgi:hypothetical protein
LGEVACLEERVVELVYLWVEDYKNIHEQGFNFSLASTHFENSEKALRL